MRKIFVLLLLTVFSSLSLFSQVTISQEDYNKLSSEAKAQIEQLTTEKAVRGEIQEVSEYANLGKEIGVAVNETLKAVEDSAIRISESDLGQTAITIVVWKLLYKEIAGLIVGFVLLILCIYFAIIGKSKLSDNADDVGGWVCVLTGIVFFIASMICMFG